MNIDNVTDNIKFWKTVKPFISEKRHNTQNILLVEGENIISTNKEVADTMNNFFSCATKSLDIPSNFYLTNFTNLDDLIDQIKYKYKSNPSIIKIKENFGTSESFSFMEISYTEMEHELSKVNVKKSTTFKNIPTKLLKDTSDICCDTLLEIINKNIKNNIFPNELKLADVTPVFKKGDATNAKKLSSC